jgi:flagellar basal-body rod protein FlgF
MQSSLYVALSAQTTLNHRLESIAANVANATTAGYRADVVKFDSLVTRRGDADVAYAVLGRDSISRETGPVTPTGNPFDVAVSGDGFFGIATPAGTAYTRDGRLQVGASGALETLNGYALLDAGGSPIFVDPSAGPPEIARDGMMAQGGRQIGAIGLFSIDTGSTLTRFGNSAVIPDRPATPVLDFAGNGVLQGHVEGSNVKPVVEMTRLIAVQRAFEQVTASLDMADSTQQDAIKTLGATS